MKIQSSPSAPLAKLRICNYFACRNSFWDNGCNSKLTTFYNFKAYIHYLWKAIAQLNQVGQMKFSFISLFSQPKCCIVVLLLMYVMSSNETTYFLKLNGTSRRKNPFKLEMNDWKRVEMVLISHK